MFNFRLDTWTNAGVRLAFGALLMAVVFTGACRAQGVQTQNASPLGNKEPGKAETAAGNLVADAVRKALRTDIAFVAASELKPKDEPFAEGKVSSTDIAVLVSYPDDPLAELELDGKSVRQALERSVSIHPQPNLGFLQVSGLQFGFDPAKPSGQRVTTVTVNGVPLGDDTRYTIGLTNSMANGALGYWKVWSPDKVKRRFADRNLIVALEAYLKANPKIDYGTLDRIIPAK